LIDEDFPPVIAPYSRTSSDLDRSSPFYASVDAGIKLLWGPDFHFGVFGGYHFLNESLSAYGCGQTATNPFICAGGIPGFVKVISQENRWHSARVGIDAAIEVGRWKLSADAAWVPYVWLDGSDAHWLRIGTNPGDFTGPVPENGSGWGYQLEAVLAYRVTDALSVGVGGRYWRMEIDGHTHFEGHVLGFAASPQVVNWKTENYGVFLQGNLKLGPYPLISSN
jgi:outer membrane protease